MSRLLAKAATVVAVLVCSVAVAGRDQQQPPLRSTVLLVPIDVRVVDANGDPVPGLTASDFAVYENGAKQDIAHFMTLSYSTDQQPDLSSQSSVEPFGLIPQSHRTFIILLARGRLNGPARGIDAAIAFIKGLLPTDRVALIAFLRASKPTTDHGAAIRFLERYRHHHEALEGRLQADFRRLAFDPVTLSTATRREIDALFRGDEIPSFVELPGATGTTASRYLNLNYLRRAIQFGRRFGGEKHLIVLTDKPLPLGQSTTDDRSGHILVKLANESRVTLSHINTGGLSGHTMIRGGLFISRGAGTRSASGMGITDRDFFAPGDHRDVAEATGGFSSFYREASSTFGRLERSSRVQYLLAYYPKSAPSPDTYRSIRVEINRPGVSAHYRHGYRLGPSQRDEDDFRNAIAAEAVQQALTRLTDAAPRSMITNARVAPPALRIQPSMDQEHRLVLNIAFDPRWVAFKDDGGEFRAILRLGIVVDDRSGHQVGELTRSLNLALSSDEYARTKKDWLAIDVTVPVQGLPSRVRAAAYDYEADRTMAAAATITIRR